MLMVIHIPAPATERWKDADETPEPASPELDETGTEGPVPPAPGDGAVRDPVGAVLSTLTLPTVGELNVLPTLSVVTTRRS